MPDKKINAVLFDLGETLVSYGKLNSLELIKQGAQLSYDYLKSCNQPVVGFRRYYLQSIAELYLQRALSKVTGRDFDALKLFESIGTQRGIHLNQKQWEQYAWLWYQPLSNLAYIEPDLQQTLNKLKEMNLKLGILSNTFVHSSTLDRQLADFGILEFLPVRIYSYEFKHRKPASQIFKTACEKLQLPPENIMFVGDRIDKDIKPAEKTGMTAVLKKAYSNKNKKLPQGTYRIQHLSQLPRLIEKINSDTTANQTRTSNATYQ